MPKHEVDEDEEGEEEEKPYKKAAKKKQAKKKKAREEENEEDEEEDEAPRPSKKKGAKKKAGKKVTHSSSEEEEEEEGILLEAKPYSFAYFIRMTQSIHCSSKLSIEAVANILEEYGCYGLWKISVDKNELKEYSLECSVYLLCILLYLKVNEQPSSRKVLKYVNEPENYHHILHDKLDRRTIHYIRKINSMNINENIDYLQVAVDAIINELRDSKNQFIYKRELRNWSDLKSLMAALGSVMDMSIMYCQIEDSKDVSFQVAPSPSQSKALIVLSKSGSKRHIQVCFNKFQYYAGSRQLQSNPVFDRIDKYKLKSYFTDMPMMKYYVKYITDISFSYDSLKSKILKFKSSLENHKKHQLAPQTPQIVGPIPTNDLSLPMISFPTDIRNPVRLRLLEIKLISKI
jgi:hypothetical protein